MRLVFVGCAFSGGPLLCPAATRSPAQSLFHFLERPGAVGEEVSVNVEGVYRFMSSERLAVLATVDGAGRPEAALMGFAVTPELEIVFDTVKTSRKYPNLKQNPRVAWVIGCATEVTVQYEGIAKELSGEELAKYKKTYFAVFPDGPARESWPGITYFVVRPKWVRYCDYNPGTRRMEEMEF